MALTHQDTAVNQLIINRLTKQEFDNLPSYSNTELYIVPEQLDSVVTQNSTNPVQSGAVYNAIQDNHEIIFCHMLDGEIFNETVIECTEVNGEIFNPQELIDRPDDPRPLLPDGNYYYATNTNKVYGGEVGDNEFIDVTTSVMIEGDETKLYCDVDSDKLYRYDGTDFIMVGGGGVTSYNDLTDKPLSVENGKVKYTLSDGETKLNLVQDTELASTTVAGLMSAADKIKLNSIEVSTEETFSNGNSYAKVVKYGRVVHCYLFANNTSSGPINITLDAKYKPIFAVLVAGEVFMNSGTAQFEIDTDGKIRVSGGARGMTATTYISAS